MSLDPERLKRIGRETNREFVASRFGEYELVVIKELLKNWADSALEITTELKRRYKKVPSWHIGFGSSLGASILEKHIEALRTFFDHEGDFYGTDGSLLLTDDQILQILFIADKEELEQGLTKQLEDLSRELELVRARFRAQLPIQHAIETATSIFMSLVAVRLKKN